MGVNPLILIKKLTMDAENGDLDAQKNLALLYYAGEDAGIETNYVQSRKWALIAANRGSSEAQSILGELYSKGLGGEQDYDKAIYWYEKAVAQGEITAEIGLLLAMHMKNNR